MITTETQRTIPLRRVLYASVVINPLLRFAYGSGIGIGLGGIGSGGIGPGGIGPGGLEVGTVRTNIAGRMFCSQKDGTALPWNETTTGISRARSALRWRSSSGFSSTVTAEIADSG